MRIGCVRIPDVPSWAYGQTKGVTDPFVVLEQGRVAGASRTPRKSGVEPGQTRLKAASLCKKAKMLPRDPAAEQTAWEAFVESLNAHTPRIDSVRRGLAWIEPRSQSKLRRWVNGTECHCGIGPRRPVALMAAWKATAGRIICIEREYEESFLSRIPTEALSEVGFSEDIADRLRLFGYKSVEDLYELSERHLTAQFGEEGGELYDFLHPESSRVPFYSPPPTITSRQDFEQDAQQSGVLEDSLGKSAESLEERLEEKVCQRLTVRLLGRQETTEASRILREPVAREGPIRRAASVLLKQALKADMEIHALVLEAGGLQSPSGVQANLFRNQPALEEAIATIQEKYSEALYRVHRDEGAVFEEDRFTYEPLDADA